jgi:putative ABC transport system permease protein
VSLRFAFAHAGREARSSVRRLGVYMLAITLGVAALVGVNSFRTNVVRSVENEARVLLGADLRLGSNRAFPDSVEAVLDSAANAGLRVTRLTQLVSMALAPDGRARLIQLRAISGEFPFYGEYRTAPPGVWPPRGDDALIEPVLRAQLGLAVGDTVRIGDAAFVVRGSVENLPPEAGFQTAVGPRVFIDGARIAATNLVGVGTMARYHAYLEIPNARELQRFVDRHHDVLRRNAVSFDTADEQAENLATALDALGRFLGLVGLAALLLGGVGVASAVNVFVREKRATVAVLRCIGATQGTAFTAYLVQAALLGVAGAVVGALLGIALQWLLPYVVRDVLPVAVETGIAWTAVLAGIGIGTAVATLFALLPLLEIRGISPLRVLRQPVEETRPRFDVLRAITFVALAALVVALSVWQAGDRNAGLAFAAGLSATLLLLRIAAWLLTRVTRRLVPATAAFTTRQGLAGLFRPYNQTAAVTLALGFGVFLIASLWIVQRNLLDWIAMDDMVEQPNIVAFDIQRDQRAGVADVLRAHGVAQPEFVPIVPARIAALDGVSAEELLRDARARNIEPWTLRREYRHTYRAHMTSGETLAAGAWWDANGQSAADALPRVSVERDLARNLNITLGSRVTWNFQGVEIETVVASLRIVDWARFETNFFVVFEPGVIEEAPQMLVALAHVPDDSVRGALQGALVRRHANVSTVDLASVQRTLAEIVGRVALAIRFMATFSIVAGVLVLAGAIAAARFQRVRESVLLRALGATRAQVRRILLTEYLALGTVAGLTGTLLGAIAAWGLISQLFNLEFRLHALDLVIIAASVAAASALLGMANSRDAVRTTPLAALREAE